MSVFPRGVQDVGVGSRVPVEPTSETRDRSSGDGAQVSWLHRPRGGQGRRQTPSTAPLVLPSHPKGAPSAVSESAGMHMQRKRRRDWRGAVAAAGRLGTVQGKLLYLSGPCPLRPTCRPTCPLPPGDPPAQAGPWQLCAGPGCQGLSTCTLTSDALPPAPGTAVDSGLYLRAIRGTISHRQRETDQHAVSPWRGLGGEDDLGEPPLPLGSPPTPGVD